MPRFLYNVNNMGAAEAPVVANMPAISSQVRERPTMHQHVNFHFGMRDGRWGDV